MKLKIILTIALLSLVTSSFAVISTEAFVPPEYCEEKKQDANCVSGVTNCRDITPSNEHAIKGAGLGNILDFGNKDNFKKELYKYAIEKLIKRNAKFREINGTDHITLKNKWDTSGYMSKIRPDIYQSSVSVIEKCLAGNDDNTLLEMYQKELKGEIDSGTYPKDLTAENKTDLFLAEKLVNLIRDDEPLKERGRRVRKLESLVGVNGDLEPDISKYRQLIPEDRGDYKFNGRSKRCLDKNVRIDNELKNYCQHLSMEGGTYLVMTNEINEIEAAITKKIPYSGSKEVQDELSALMDTKREYIKNLKAIEKEVANVNKELSPGGEFSINNFDRANIERRNWWFAKDERKRGAKIYNRKKVSHHDVYTYSDFGQKTLNIIKNDKLDSVMIDNIKAQLASGDGKAAIATAVVYLKTDRNKEAADYLKSDVKKHITEAYEETNAAILSMCEKQQTKDYLAFNKGLVRSFIEENKENLPKSDLEKIHCQVIAELDYPEINAWMMGGGILAMGGGAISGATGGVFLPAGLVVGGAIMGIAGILDANKLEKLKYATSAFEESDNEQAIEILRASNIAKQLSYGDYAGFIVDVPQIYRGLRAAPAFAKSAKNLALRISKAANVKEKFNIFKLWHQDETAELLKRTVERQSLSAHHSGPDDSLIKQKLELDLALTEGEDHVKLKELFMDKNMQKLFSDAKNDKSVIEYIKIGKYDPDDQERILQIIALLRKEDQTLSNETALKRLNDLKCKTCKICGI